MAELEKALKGLECCGNGNMCRGHCPYDGPGNDIEGCTSQLARDALSLLKVQEPSKYEYHTDHTDCIWYGTEDNNCPSTCSQYRDGWNDAMDYIFKNGKGYRPYKRR